MKALLICSYGNLVEADATPGTRLPATPARLLGRRRMSGTVEGREARMRRMVTFVLSLYICSRHTLVEKAGHSTDTRGRFIVHSEPYRIHPSNPPGTAAH